jgi:hypothetical protein
MEKRIFTFWEPRTSIPGYLKLCMLTWKKFLPEYEVVMLDYANLDQWLGKNCYDKSLYENFTLPKQADAVRCAVLNRWGGVWFDTDTIVTSDKIHDLLCSDAAFTLLGTHIGFIIAQKHAVILRIWERAAKLKVNLYKYYHKNLRFFHKFPMAQRMERWDFLGNSILKWPLRVVGGTAFKSIDKIAVNAFPELNRDFGSLSLEENYVAFYFGNNPVDAASRDGGIICLHNSWTPELYKSMSAAEFLRQNITLSRILKSILVQRSPFITVTI